MELQRESPEQHLNIRPKTKKRREIIEINPFGGGQEPEKQKPVLPDRKDTDKTLETIAPKKETASELLNKAIELIRSDIRLLPAEQNMAARELLNLVNRDWAGLPVEEVDEKIKDYFQNAYRKYLNRQIH